jgi:hypothetical protein
MVSSFERQILFRKYVHLGYLPEEASLKIKSFCDYLKALKVKLNKCRFNEVDINARFKREFEKLCQRLDAGEEVK